MAMLLCCGLLPIVQLFNRAPIVIPLGAPPIEEGPSFPTPIQFERVVTARPVFAGLNTELEETDTFSTDEQAIFVVGAFEWLEGGTTVSAVWSREDEVIEESEPVVANQDYQNDSVEFVFQADGPDGFAAGNYSVTIFVNGEAAETVPFVVVEE
jgi:hypothetical protein